MVYWEHISTDGVTKLLLLQQPLGSSEVSVPQSGGESTFITLVKKSREIAYVNESFFAGLQLVKKYFCSGKMCLSLIERPSKDNFITGISTKVFQN